MADSLLSVIRFLRTRCAASCRCCTPLLRCWDPRRRDRAGVDVSRAVQLL